MATVGGTSARHAAATLAGFRQDGGSLTGADAALAVLRAELSKLDHAFAAARLVQVLQASGPDLTAAEDAQPEPTITPSILVVDDDRELTSPPFDGKSAQARRLEGAAAKDGAPRAQAAAHALLYGHAARRLDARG